MTKKHQKHTNITKRKNGNFAPNELSILGAKYELKDGTLTNDYPLAVSNTFVGNDVSVEVKKGALLIIYDR